ncbi:transposable element Tc1 transposase [Trichonephila clavipes]|nr:transposable element Tc1 transposase [Trichonephila clavipes]
MPPRRNKEKYQQLTEFECGRIIGLRNRGISHHAIEARVQRNSSTVMRVWKQWTYDHRTTRKTGSGQRKGMLRQFADVCCTVNCVQGCLYKGFFSRQTIDDCDYDGRFRDRSYADECYLPECVISRHSSITARVMVWGVISYHGQSNLLRIEGNLNSNRCVREVLQPEVIPFLQGPPGAIFQQDNARPHVPKTVRDYISAQHM